MAALALAGRTIHGPLLLSAFSQGAPRMIVAGLRKCMRAAAKPALLAGAVAALLLRPASGLSLILGDR